MPKLIKLSIIFLLLLLNVFPIGLSSVQAAGFVPPPTGTGNCPAGYTGDNCGDYQLNDIMQVALIVSQFILGIVGSLALFAFVAGGLMWMFSAGDAEWVMRGKRSIIGAVVGLAIVFTSYMIIQLVFAALGIPNTAAGQWATSGWTSVWPK